MAVPTLTNVPSVISLCESTTGWSGDTFSLEPDNKVQGGNSVSCAMTNNGVNNIQYATSNSPGGQFSATNIHIRVWINLAFVGNINTAANNGIQIQVVSVSGTALYTVAGSDTYSGGWAQFVIYTGNTPTSGSVPAGTCTAVGLTVNTNSKPRNQPANCWVDAWYFGDGYTVTGGTNGDELTWADIAAVDFVNAYGIVTNVDDVNFLAGDIQIGNGTTTTWFKSGEKCQFRDLAVSSTLYGVTFAGSGCTVDITGGSFGSAGNTNYNFDASDTSVTFTLTGVQFAKGNNIDFAAGQSVTNCVFDDCTQVDPSTAVFEGHTFRNATSSGALLWRDSINTKNLEFINCANGVQFTTTSTPKSFDNIVFDDVGGNFDVNNTTASAIEVNLTNGSNANSYNGAGSLVTFASSVLLSLTVKDEDGVPIENAFAYIDENNQSPFIMNTTTNASGVASATWTGGAVVGATWRVRLYGYKPFKVIADIGTENQDIPVTLIVDPQALINPNPPTGPTNLATEGDFSNGGAAWSLTGGASVVSEQLVISGTGSAFQNMGVLNKPIRVYFDVLSNGMATLDYLRIKAGDAAFDFVGDTDGTGQFIFEGIATGDLLTFNFVGSGSVTIDNVEVYELDTGLNLFTNSGFTGGGTGWTSSLVVFANDEVTFNQFGNLYQDLSPSLGQKYILRCRLRSSSSNAPTFKVGTGNQEVLSAFDVQTGNWICKGIEYVNVGNTDCGMIGSVLAGTGWTVDDLEIYLINGEI